MSLRNKILLSIWAVVLSLLIITFFVINYWTRAGIETTIARELRTDRSTVEVHEKLQAEQLIRACAVVAESPRLRAVAELGDTRTARQLLHELTQTTLSQMLVLSDRRGRVMVQLLRGVDDTTWVTDPATISRALSGTPAVDVWSVHGTLFRVVAVPIIIESDILGTLTTGFEITAGEITALKQATNSDVLLVSGTDVVLSTVAPAEVRSLLPAIFPRVESGKDQAADTALVPFAVQTSDATYLGTTVRVHRAVGAHSPPVSYFLIRSVSSEVRQSMAAILGTFGVVSLVFLAFTTVIGLVISRSMTRPIQQLVTGTAEISRGNYDYVIPVRSRDEVGYLATRFMEMSASLKDKVTQLALLNESLVERNRDLDETLRQLKRAQEELVRSERLALTGRLTAQLSHEINNPIHNIQSLLELSLRKTGSEDPARELIGVALEEVVRMAKLTRQMLDLFRGSVHEGEQDIVDVNDLLQDVVRLYTEQFAQQHIDLTFAIAARQAMVRGSRDKLKQVMLNLVNNASDAIQAMRANGQAPDSAGSIAITASNGEGVITVEVTDNGCGIEEENLHKIYDAFFTTKKEMSGVGLGLSVSHAIIQQHKGSIAVKSSMGKGTTFTITLPMI